MFSSSTNHATRQRLVENITLLWTLDEIPEEPKDNISLREDDRKRQLTLDRERQLADSFAFISASTDDIVMAVSIEEDVDDYGITVRLASNTGDLSSMKKALGDIAKALEKAAKRIDSRTTIRRELFIQIVTLDRSRILSRLRSRHAEPSRKTLGKPALPALLSRTINDPTIKAGGTSAKVKVAKARAQTRQIVEAFDKFETAHDVGTPSLSEERLVDVLIEAYDFDTKNLRIALQSPSSINPELVKFLPQAISKLGRYFCIACDLVNAARSSQYTIFGRVTIKVLEEPVLDTRSIINGLLDFDAALERITSLSHQYQGYGSKALSLARTRYHARISSRVPPWKAHAEIQLLFFYEYNSHVPPPRFICSSKIACYLCDLFVKSYGKFSLPRTHGRLYDRWILPDWSVDQSLQRQSIQIAIDRFNTTLESKILETLNTKRPSFHHPNESVPHLREPWSSNSTLPAWRAQQSITDITIDSKNKATKILDDIPPTAPGLIDDDFSTNNAFEERNVESGETSSETVIPNQTVAEVQSIVSPSGLIVMLLSRGDTLCHRLTPACDTLIVRTDAVTLHASWDWNPKSLMKSDSDPSLMHDDCWVQVKWLSRGDRITGGPQDIDSIDLETLSSIPGKFEERIFEGGSALSHKALSIRNGGHTLVVQYYWEDPQCE